MSSYVPLFGDGKNEQGDVENALYPGISGTDNILRLGYGLEHLEAAFCGNYEGTHRVL